MKELLNHLSFKLKLILIVCGISVLSVSIVLNIRSSQIEKILKERMEFRTNVIANIISLTVLDEDKINQLIVQKYKKYIKKEIEIEYIIILDKNNRIIERIGNYDSNHVITKTNNILDVNDKFYDVYNDILNIKGYKVGSIVVGFPLASLTHVLHLHVVSGFILWISVIVFIMFSTYLALSYFLKPLNYLYQGTIQMSKKNFSYRIPTTNKDEIGQVSEHFNIMSQELMSFYQELEMKVKKAVNGLEFANKSLKIRSEELEKMNLKLEEIDKRKSEFVSIVSHDLKTPLTSIMGFADTLMNKKLNLTEKDKDSFLNIIGIESRRLARLISDFLDLSKIEEGVMKLKIEKGNIEEIVRCAIDVIDAKQITISLESNLNKSEINFDKDRIMQVLQNIIGNAIKHSSLNSNIIIGLKQNDHETKISISDQGPGVNDKEKELIFKKFYRSDNDISKKERGTGLGLMIAKSIIEMHGGKIWVEDNKPVGSRFIFTLPL